MGTRTNTRTTMGSTVRETGSELHDDANAMSDPNSNEADATTGWSQVGLDAGSNVFDSDTWANLSITAGTGDYTLVANANDTPTTDARFYKDIGTDWSLTAGKAYRMSFNARHVGSGGSWGIRFTSNSGLTSNSSLVVFLASTDTTFTNYTYDFIYSTNFRYFGGKEGGPGDSGGVYIDNLSCKQILP